MSNTRGGRGTPNLVRRPNERHWHPLSYRRVAGLPAIMW
jgi:hypothetical protein